MPSQEPAPPIVRDVSRPGRASGRRRHQCRGCPRRCIGRDRPPINTSGSGCDAGRLRRRGVRSGFQGAGLAGRATRADAGAATAYARSGGPRVHHRSCRRRSDGDGREPGPGLPGHTSQRPLRRGRPAAWRGRCCDGIQPLAQGRGCVLGPALQRAADGGRIVFVPHNRDLELYGVDAELLPNSANAAAQRVIELLWPDRAGSSSPQRRKGHRR